MSVLSCDIISKFSLALSQSKSSVKFAVTRKSNRKPRQTTGRVLVMYESKSFGKKGCIHFTITQNISNPRDSLKFTRYRNRR